MSEDKLSQKIGGMVLTFGVAALGATVPYIAKIAKIETRLDNVETHEISFSHPPEFYKQLIESKIQRNKDDIYRLQQLLNER